MEVNINTYKLNQGNKEYILTISMVGNSLRITCKDSINENLSFSRDFTIEELQKLDSIFKIISTPLEALDYMDKALKIQKVGITEEDDTLKINFFVTTQGVIHQLEIPLGESGSVPDFNNFNENVEQYIETTNTTTTSGYNINQNQNLDLNLNNLYQKSYNITNETLPTIKPAEPLDQYTSQYNSVNTVTNTTYNQLNETLPTIKPAEPLDQYTSQYNTVNTVTNTTYSQLNDVNANGLNGLNLASELVEGNGNVINEVVDNNVYQETQNNYTFNTTNMDYMQGVDNTDNNLQNTELLVTDAGLNANIQYTGEITDTTNQYISGGNGILTSEYLTGDNVDLTSQFTAGITQDLNTQYNTGINQDFTTQYTTNAQEISTNTHETLPFITSVEQDLSNLDNKYVDTTTDIKAEYTNNNAAFNGSVETTNSQYSNEYNTYSASSPINLKLGDDISNFAPYKKTTTTQSTQTTHKSYKPNSPTYSAPFITPVDDIDSKIEIKPYIKTTPSMQTATQNNYYSQTTKTTRKTMKKKDPTANVVSIPNQTATATKFFSLPLPLVKKEKKEKKEVEIKEPPKPIIKKSYTDNQTQYDIKTEEKIKPPDPRLNQLEGATSSLKSEHQLIQDKLNALTGQINAYKSQLSFMERAGNDSEISNLRAENKAIKQQLLELNSLRNDAAEVKFLRNQLQELDPLRKKVAEMEILKSQLGELNSLRAKVSEYNKIKAQLEELNKLRLQVAQMNVLKQQLGELDTLRRKVAELKGVKAQLGELNNLRAQVGQINLLKKQLQELTKLKLNALDLEKLRLKIDELENIKLGYEKEILELKTKQKAQILQREIEKQKYAEYQMRRSSGMESKQLYIEDMPQQICVKGDIIHNTDELELLTRKMNKSNQRITLNLLYKATADSDKAEAFHAKCDDARSTLVLVETDKGRRFGGFTTCSWSGDCVDKRDEDAFIFSLDKMEVYDNIPGEDAIGCYPKFGPIFLGCQIRIYDNAFTKGGTTYEKGLNFNTEEDYELTGGERSFIVREIEVYEVIPS